MNENSSGQGFISVVLWPRHKLLIADYKSGSHSVFNSLGCLFGRQPKCNSGSDKLGTIKYVLTAFESLKSIFQSPMTIKFQSVV